MAISLVNPFAGKFSFFQLNNCTRSSHSMSPFVVSVSNQTKRKFPQIVTSASMAFTNSPLSYSPSITDNFGVDENPAETRIDEWAEGSVTRIVQNLKQAPLLVHVYPEFDGRGDSKFGFETEKAIRENWPSLKNKWRNGEMRYPDGIIFVEELVDESSNEGRESEGGKDGEEEKVTKAWGIVVQGKGVKCGPACYLLKTSRVEAGSGLGLFCTHFCLTKVTDFRETALKLLQDCWLLE